mgnify:CR=1 FL=1
MMLGKFELIPPPLLMHFAQQQSVHLVAFVRHGDIEQPYSLDPGLTPLGASRIGDLCSTFAPFSNCLLVHSAKRRARETAAILCKGIDVREVRELELLREVNPQALTGIGYSPDQEVESDRLRALEVTRVLTELAYKYKRVMIVSHKNLLNFIVGTLNSKGFERDLFEEFGSIAWLRWYSDV